MNPEKLSPTEVVQHAVNVRQALLNAPHNDEAHESLTCVLDEIKRAQNGEEALAKMAVNLFEFAALFNRDTDPSWRAMVEEYKQAMKQAGRDPRI